MAEDSVRMTDGGQAPDAAQLQAWLGKRAHSYWARIVAFIDENYPDVFVPEWLFGGQKHGWSLRYKKGRSFCTLIPERKCCSILIVFGKEERAKVDAMRHELSLQTLTRYDEATTYHDGKWLRLTVDSQTVLWDVERLLTAKRRPKKPR